jgi:hypothetical protein
VYLKESFCCCRATIQNTSLTVPPAVANGSVYRNILRSQFYKISVNSSQAYQLFLWNPLTTNVNYSMEVIAYSKSSPGSPFHMSTVDSPQIGHAQDPDKPVALRVCPISRPQCKFNSELQIGQLSDSRTKLPTYRTICSFFAQHSSEPDGPFPEEKASFLAM